MSRVLFISDTHFGHKNITRYRPFETVEAHDQFVFKSIMDEVTKRDILWILGDICMNIDSLHYVSEIKQAVAKFCICLGNHDKDKGSACYNAGLSVQCMADEVHGMSSRYGYWLSHAPIHPNELRGKKNIHGHDHGLSLKDENYINVCCEALDYKPVSLQKLRKKNHDYNK